MRKTVTLDRDVEQLLSEVVRETGESLDVVLNRAVREGLAKQGDAPVETPFRVRARRMGLRVTDCDALKRELDQVEIDGILDGQVRAGGRERG